MKLGKATIVDDAILFNEHDEIVSDDKENVASMARRFVVLSKRERELKDELNQVQEEKKQIEPHLMSGFENGSIQRITIDGVTVFVHRQIWASPKDGDYERACQALRDAGWGDMVHERFNTNTVSAAVRELDNMGEELPDALMDALEVSEVFSLRTRAR